MNAFNLRQPPAESVASEDPNPRLEALESSVAELRRRVEATPPTSGVALLVSSADLDRQMAALMIATGAASMGVEAYVFFAFFGIAALRRPAPPPRPRSPIDRVLGWFLPKGRNALGLSHMHFGGLGTLMLQKRMRDHNVPDLNELFAMAAEGGVRMSVCATSLDLMGLQRGDLIDYPGLEACGVGTFLSRGHDSRVTLFV